MSRTKIVAVAIFSGILLQNASSGYAQGCNRTEKCCRHTHDTTALLINYKNALKNVKIQGASVNGSCDPTLHTNFVSKIYSAHVRNEFVTAVSNLLKHLEANPSLEAKSCFSYYEQKLANGSTKPVLRYNECSSNSSTCQCHSDGGFKSYFNEKTQECHIFYPALGDPCNATRTYEMNKHFFDEFREKLDTTADEKAVTATLTKFRENYRNFLKYESLESDIRDACFSPDFSHNMECKLGKCACVDYGKHFKYVKDAKDLCKCGGIRSSICHLKSEKVCNGKNCKEILEPEFTYAKAECAFASCVDSSFHFVDDVVLKTCGAEYNSAHMLTLKFETVFLNCIALCFLYNFKW